MKLFKLNFFLFLFFSFNLFSWWDSSHMVIAKIAEENLTPSAKKRCFALIEKLSLYYPDSATFVSSATWADEVANHNFTSWEGHVYVKPYDPDNFLTETKTKLILTKMKACNAVTWLKQSVCCLKDKRSNDLEKAIMLRFLIHIVGDLHQPLHCASLYSEEFPNGDRAGCFYKLDLAKQKNNLHALWDSCLQRDYIWLKKPLDENEEKYLEEFKKEIISSFPKSSLKNVADLNFENWAKESYEIAVLHAYQNIEPNSSPSEEYLKSNRKIAYERISLAGFRLSELLNSIFTEKTEGQK